MSHRGETHIKVRCHLQIFVIEDPSLDCLANKDIIVKLAEAISPADGTLKADTEK